MFRDTDETPRSNIHYNEILRDCIRNNKNPASIGPRLGFIVPPESQKDILFALLLNGSETVYGLHKMLNMPLSTVGSAINQMVCVGTVIWADKKEEDRRNKKYYALTLCGFFLAVFQLIGKVDKDLVKTVVTQGFKQWSSLCPEFFDHWKDLTDDTKHLGSSDYWFELLYRASRKGYYITSKEQFFTTLALLLWEDWIDRDASPDGYYAAAAVKEIPDIWSQISPTLCKIRDDHREIMKKMDALLS